MNNEKYINLISETKLVGDWTVPVKDILISRKIDDSPLGDIKYEKHLRSFILDGIIKKRVFLDVGANIGIWSLPMSSHFEKVIAFEPDSRNMHCLERNTNGIKNIEYRNFGLGDRNELTVIRQCYKNCGNSYVLPPKNIAIEEVLEDRSRVKVRVLPPHKDNGKSFYASAIDMKTIDSLEIQDVDLIKIDTQGHELQVLKGAKNTIIRHMPWICFELGERKHMKNGYSDADIIRFLKGIGYDVCKMSKTDCIMAPIEDALRCSRSA